VNLYEVFHTHGRMVAFTGVTKDPDKVRVIELPQGHSHVIPRKVLESAVKVTEGIFEDEASGS
jgi:hypothetical protein